MNLKRMYDYLGPNSGVVNISVDEVNLFKS